MADFIRVTEAGDYGWPMLVNVRDVVMVRKAARVSDGRACVYVSSITEYITVMETVEQIAAALRAGSADA